MRTNPSLSANSRRLPRLLAAVAFGTVVLLSACGSTGEKASTTTTTAPTPTTAATTTTAAADTTTTVASGDEGSSAGNPWARDAKEYRGQIGKKVTVECPAGGEAGSIWGTETYTDDSSICTAGVHVGLITFAKGGSVTIEIGGAQDSYASATAHAVTSTSYGSWPGSYTFPDAPPGSGTFDAGPEGWSKSAASLELKAGDSAEVDCSPNGQIASIWGTGTYTADSYICTAAVHAGVITHEEGGKVKIQVKAGPDSYEGTEAHGVTSSSYGPYPLAYTFPSDQPS